MPKGKILMGKGPVKRPAPVKPKPKGGIVDPKRNPKPDGKKRPVPMPKPIPGGKRPIPMPKPGDRTLPGRPQKPRTLEEKKFIRDQLQKNPGPGTGRGKRGIVDPKRKKLTPEQMRSLQKSKQAASSFLSESKAKRKPVMPPRRGR